ncbi:MAG: endonuclease domain-containing protein [Prolixibacteraceae bacterium]|nr:endonuclease domain-containing protein [Prolixibacteraceae bacterium]
MVRLNDSFEYDFYYGASATTKAQAAELRKNMTVEEKILWQKLRNKKLNDLKFRRQHPVDIFILDFYCHEKKLAIEVDGGIHNQEAQREWDENRTYELNEFGINVLRFTNEEVIDRTKEVMKSIKDFLKLQNPIPNPSPNGEGS